MNKSRFRNIVALCFLGSAFYIGWKAWHQPSQKKHLPPKLTLNKHAATDINGLHITSLSGSALPLKGTAEQKMAAYESFYRLAPDHRFLAAIPKIASFFGRSPGPEDDVEAIFDKTQWTVRYQGEIVGTLPEIADFPDYMAMLEKWTASLNAKKPLRLSDDKSIKLDFGSYFRGDLQPALDECGRRWGKPWPWRVRSKDCLLFAAHAYSALLVQSLDYMNSFETLESTPVAYLSLAKTLTGQPLVKEEARIAYELHYTAHARGLASKLPADDPVALYVLRRSEGLQKAAQAESAGQETLVLAMFDLGRLKKRDELLALLRGRPSLISPESLFGHGAMFPILKAELWLDDFNLTPDAAQKLQFLTLSAVGRLDSVLHSDAIKSLLEEIFSMSEQGAAKMAAGGALKLLAVTDKDELTRFEQDNSRQGAGHDTPLLDADYVEAFNGGYFYSGIWADAMHRLVTLSSIPAAQEMLVRFAVPAGNFQKEFGLWYADLIDSTLGKLSAERLFQMLERFQLLGADPLLRAYYTSERLFPPGAPDLRNAVKIVFSRLDSGPTGLDTATYIAQTRLFDLALADKYAAASASIKPDDRYGARTAAVFHGDLDALRRQVEEAKGDMEEELHGCEALERLNAPANEMEAIYLDMIQRYPNRWAPSKAYIRVLRDRGLRKKAVLVAKQWIARNPYNKEFDRLFAASSLAKDLNALGRHPEALKAVAPFIDSWQGGILDQYAISLAALHRHKEADSVFQQAVERYPMSDYILPNYIEFLWQRQRYADAAKMFTPVVLEDAILRDVGERFVKEFGKRADLGKKAFAALKPLPADKQLLFLRPAIAAGVGYSIDLLDMIPDPRPDRQLGILFCKYEVLKKSKGKESAVRYLQGAIPSFMLAKSSLLMFENFRYELLWDLIEVPPPNDHPEMIWLLRATAFALAGGSPAHEAQLLEYYKQPTKNDQIIALGKYILGLCPLQEALASTKDRNTKLGEAAFYVGVKAIKDKDFETANRWLQLAIETADFNNRELAWANILLNIWTSEGTPLRLRKSFAGEQIQKQLGLASETHQGKGERGRPQ